MTAADLLHLRAGGVSLVVDPPAGPCRGSCTGAPTWASWTARPEAVRRAWAVVPHGFPADGPVEVAILPQESAGFLGTPGLVGSRAGQDFSTLFAVRSHEVVTTPDGTQRLTVDAVDGAARLTLEIEARAHRATGWCGCGPCSPTTPTNRLRPRRPAPRRCPSPPRDRAARLHRTVAARTQPPAPRLHARHPPAREPARVAPATTPPSCSSPATPGFGFRTRRGLGRAHRLERQPPHARRAHRTGAAVLGGGELLLPGEIRLAPGERTHARGSTARYGARPRRARRAGSTVHARPARSTRARRGRSCSTPGRPSTSTTTSTGCSSWPTRAAEVGAERFVLDDGWFVGRRDDRAGLGDWYVDRGRSGRTGCTRWSTTSPSSACSSGCGSSRRWSTRTPTSPARTPTGSCARRRPAAAASRATSRCSTWRIPDGVRLHRSSGLDALLTEYAIGYLKWDHNRDLVDAGHRPDGAPGVHGQTLAVYRLMDELRGAAPRAGDRVVLRRAARRVDLGDPGAHRPGLGQRLHRRARAAADPAVHRAAGAAGADRHARRLADRRTPPAGGTTCRSAPRPRCSATWASSGTCRRPTAAAARRAGAPGSPCTRTLRPLLHTGTRRARRRGRPRRRGARRGGARPRATRCSRSP